MELLTMTVDRKFETARYAFLMILIIICAEKLKTHCFKRTDPVKNSHGHNHILSCLALKGKRATVTIAGAFLCIQNSRSHIFGIYTAQHGIINNRKLDPKGT